MSRVMSVLDAQVAEDEWEGLTEGYRSIARGSEVVSPVVETFLLQSTDDRTLWRIATIWESREALDEYLRSVETPAGRLIFQGAGAEPTLSVWEVAAKAP
ncbi:MAG: antibiotic biosynthesis monooxygenase [Actinomycetota bacterium]